MRSELSRDGIRWAGAVVMVGLLTACGGGGGQPDRKAGPATVLSYTNPASTGFRLEAAPSSNHTAHLVLRLVGPAGTQAHGVAFILKSRAQQCLWASPGGSDPLAKAGTAFSLGPVPLFLTRHTAAAPDELQVGIFQTGASAATLGADPLVEVALDLVADPSLLAGTQIPLVCSEGRYLDGQRRSQTMAVAVGTLNAE